MLPLQRKATMNYMTIGSAWYVGKGSMIKPYSGDIIASKDAFFLIGGSRLEAVWISNHLGSFVGEKVSNFLGNEKEALVYKLNDLPSVITSDSSWPDFKNNESVIAIPRGSIKEIKYSFWGTFDLDTGDKIFQLNLDIFTRKKIINYLRECKWVF